MENVINIEVTHALFHLAAEKDIRQYLNGIYVDFQLDKTVYVATNGHLVGIYTEAAQNEHAFSVIIPRDVVKQLKLKLKTGKAKWGKLIYDLESKAGRILNSANSQDLGFTPPPGTYPNYQRVIPEETSGEAGQFNAEYIYAFVQVNKALGARYPGMVKIDHNGEGAALIHFSDAAFTGILMPCRV